MLRLYLFLLILNISGLVTIVFSARILGVVPTPSFSHQIVFRPIFEQLAKNGHDLVVLTTDPWQTNFTNKIKQIDLNHSYKIWREHNAIKVLEDSGNNLLKLYKNFTQLMCKIADSQLGHPEVIKLLNNKNEHFDLLIVEYLNSIMYGLSNHFNCSYIGVTTLDMIDMFHSLFGNPVHPILYPSIMLPYDNGVEMTFKQRFINTILSFVGKTISYTNNYQCEREIMEKYFGKNLPPIRNIIKNASLVLMNSNPIFNKRPLGPMTIPFGGGVHLQPPKPLPKDLSEFLDGAKDGFIYFSFGTNVNEKNIKPSMRQIFLNVFKTLPYRVLWKFNVDVPNLPKNVKISKWIPQQDVLRHPNIKLFIMQGGLQSMEEAISTKVPILVVPFIADQIINAERIVQRGIGLSLNKDELSENALKVTIEEVISNPKYKLRVTEIAKLSADQPMPGVDKAVWWIEYVLRHNGAKHLRNQAAMDIPLYQYLLLDTLSVLFLIIASVLYIFWKIIKFLLSKIGFRTKKLKKN